MKKILVTVLLVLLAVSARAEHAFVVLSSTDEIGLVKMVREMISKVEASGTVKYFETLSLSNVSVAKSKPRDKKEQKAIVFFAGEASEIAKIESLTPVESFKLSVKYLLRYTLPVSPFSGKNFPVERVVRHSFKSIDELVQFVENYNGFGRDFHIQKYADDFNIFGGLDSGWRSFPFIVINLEFIESHGLVSGVLKASIDTN